MSRPARQRPSARRVSCWVLGIAASLDSAYIAWRAGGDAGIVAGCVLVLLVCLPLAARLLRDPLDGPGIYATLSALCYGVMSLSWIGDTPPIPAPGVARGDVAQALVLVACGLLAFNVAARLAAGPARPRPPLTGGESDRMPVLLLVGLYVVGAVGLAIGLKVGAIGFNSDAAASTGTLAYNQGFQQLGLLGGLASGAFALWIFRRQDRRLLWLLFALVAGQVLGGFVTGYKQQALLPVLFVGAAYVSCCGRVPWKAVAIGVAAGILVLLPATIVYRSILRPSESAGATNVRTPGGLLDETADYLNVRFRLVDSVALIHTRTPAVYPYANGHRYTLLPALVAVPRALWPDKPILNDGLEFSHTYWEIPPTNLTATPLTQPGDLYRNFAWPGVLVGMAIWGLLVGMLTRCNGERRSPRLELVRVVALVVAVAFIDSDLPQLLAGASRTLLVASVVAWLALPGATAPPGFTRLRHAAGRLARPRLASPAHGVSQVRNH
ncbi:MAG: hypothetical protein QOK16_2053 [Solirubrobacteraceae bacterium]|nr:hypothetical protein [Solirubrobacteraceae bacterium]